MVEIRPPTKLLPTLFLAGGITGCPDWQAEAVETLKSWDITLINPRRSNFDVTDKKMEEEQIRWEYFHLNKADAILFWFPKETVCPITLYELGRWITSGKPIFVGCDPEYTRKRDLEIQLSCLGFKSPIHLDLGLVITEALCHPMFKK
jgi:hypothetical protein